MTNSELLDKWIKLSGKKIGYLADRTGMSRQTFRKRRRNEGEFTTGQVEILCAELGIVDLDDKQAVFFAQDVA